MEKGKEQTVPTSQGEEGEKERERERWSSLICTWLLSKELSLITG